MSAAPLRASARALAPAPSREQQTAPRRHLEAVPLPQRGRSIRPFAALCVSVVVGALAAVLALNTTMAQAAYSSRDVKIEIAQLHQQRAQALTALEENAAPGALAQRAQEFGMVPAPSIGFVSLESSQVLRAGGRP